MRIAKTSQLSNVKHIWDLPVADPNNLVSWAGAPRNAKAHVQHAFPELDSDQHEFLITGITPQEWADSFGEPNLCTNNPVVLQEHHYEEPFFDMDSASIVFDA